MHFKKFWILLAAALGAGHQAYGQACTPLSIQNGCPIYAQGILQIPQILPYGTQTAPALAFQSAPSTGIYFDQSHVGLGFSVAGTEIGWWSAAGLNGAAIGASVPGTGVFTNLTANAQFFLPTWTTATRPSSPTTGETGWNTSTGLPEWWTGAAWVSAITTGGGYIPNTPTSPWYVVANGSSGTASPTDVPLGTILDGAYGSAQGNILYRGASGWTTLAPGTSGQYLKTLGTGANPAWTTLSEHGISALSWSSNVTVAAGTYITTLSWPWATGTINSVTYATGGSSTPSFTGTVSIGGTNVTGCTTVSVSSATPATATCTGANTLTSGQEVTVTIASVTGTPNTASFQINYVHSEP